MKYQELVLTKGDSYRMRVTLRSSTGFPVNISNADITAGIYDARPGVIVLFNVEKDPTGTSFVIYLSEVETAALPTTTTSSTLSWGIKISVDGTTRTLVKGQATIREGFFV